MCFVSYGWMTLARTHLETLRFRRVMFGVSSSPFLLNGTIKYHIEQFQSVDPKFVAQFLRSIYIDDVVFGASSVQEAFELYSKLKTRLLEGGFICVVSLRIHQT